MTVLGRDSGIGSGQQRQADHERAYYDVDESSRRPHDLSWESGR